MIRQKRDFHLNFRDLFEQQLLSEAGVAEWLRVLGWSSPSHQIYYRTLQETFFKNFLENHLTTKVKKFLRSLGPSKRINICVHIWKLHDSPIIWLPSLNDSLSVPDLFAACDCSWQELSQSKYLRLGKNTLLSLHSLDDMFALNEFLEHQGSMQTSQDKISSRICVGSSNYFPW